MRSEFERREHGTREPLERGITRGWLRGVAATPAVDADAPHIARQGGDLMVPLRGVERERVQEEHGAAGPRVVHGGQRVRVRRHGLRPRR